MPRASASRFGDLAEVATAAARIVVRLEITDTVAPGQAFVPMHWGSVFASNARVGALIAAGRRPDLGSARAQVQRPCACAATSRSGTASRSPREPLELPATSYRAVSRGAGYWRYELAGEELPESWSEWADARARPARRAHRVLRRGRRPLSRRQRRGRPAPSVPVRRDREVAAVAQLARDAVRLANALRRRSPRDSRGACAEGRAREPAPSFARASRSAARRCCVRFAATSSCPSSRSARRCRRARTAARASRSSKGCSPSRPRARRRRRKLLRRAPLGCSRAPIKPCTRVE